MVCVSILNFRVMAINKAFLGTRALPMAIVQFRINILSVKVMLISMGDSCHPR